MSSTASPPIKPKPAELVAQWLRLFIEPGQVVELRALGCSYKSYQRPHTEAGFFDYDHLDVMASESLRLTNFAQGVYWTINPINPELLSRRANRVDVADRGVLTQDSDVTHRRFLLVDADPVRASGISSSGSEKSLARKKCFLIRDTLHDDGWPDPILCSSGNGYHLLYKIDVPRDDEELIKKCLLALAGKFGDDSVEVDTSVFNPSRICKLYGTFAKKGDNTTDRPHRRAKVERFDGDVRTVDCKLLESLAMQSAGFSRSRGDDGRGNKTFVIDTDNRRNPRGGRQSVIERARKYLAKIDAAVSGEHGSTPTYKAAATLVDGFTLEPAEAMPLLQEFNQRCEPLWSDSELQHKLESVMSKPMPNRGHLLIDKKTAAMISRTGSSNQKNDVASDNNETIRKLVQLCIGNDEGQTDRANSRRLAHKYGHEIRYCHPWRKWLIWDGMRWRRDDSGDIMRRAKDVADHLWNDAADYAREQRLTGEDLKPLFAFAKSCAASTRLAAMIQLTASEPGIPIQPDQLDTDSFLLNCLNGTLDLSKGKLRSHDQSDHITKLCPTTFDPDAKCPEFDAFLLKIFAGNESLIEFVQTLFGYCLTGSVREQIMPIFHGTGSNGKGTLITAIMGMLGGDYSMQAPTDLLMAKKHDGHPTERASLFGMRLVASIETEDGKQLAESAVKQFTGGDPITARRMREDFWQFDPTHKIILATNHKPSIKGTDHAIWRRLSLVPFDVEFWNREKGESGPAELEQDKRLPERLKTEHAGILAWAVRGGLRWQEHGLKAPDEVRAATSEYRGAEDLVGRFVEDRCLTGYATFTIKAGTIYKSFRAWCEGQGEHPLKQRVFGERLAMMDGCERFRSGGHWWRGISLKEIDESPEDASSSAATETNEMADPFDGKF